MVSTRGVKLKFSENERVLCYEPDPTKAKVLYDSKVLDVVVNKDQRGRKSVEYLIHFQGWNSSWDRYVSEEYVLKDTPENRQLQKDLAEKSQLQLGAYLYRKDRRKHNRKNNDRIPASSDDGSSAGSPTRMDTDDGQGITSSSEDESSVEEDVVPVELTPELREWLELDYNLINSKNKLVKLPAEPSIVTILENYWRYYATSQIYDLNEKSNGRAKYLFHSQVKRRPEEIQRNLNVCSEVLDGIRIYFDFVVKDLLLYKHEEGQVETSPALYTLPITNAKEGTSVKNENFYVELLSHTTNSIGDDDYVLNDRPITRKRALRSNKSLDSHSNGTSHQEGGTKVRTCSSSSDGSLPKTSSWRILPENVYNQQPPPPCLVYGAIHLTRLFVKLPELLSASSIEGNKLKTLLQHLDYFVEFLSEHNEWFGEKFYIDK